jgi:hypothetical protein
MNARIKTCLHSATALALVSLAVSACMTAHARPVRSNALTDLRDDADLVVIGKAVASRDEPADRSYATAESWVGVNTTFKLDVVLKGKRVGTQPADTEAGKLSGREITVLHQRYFQRDKITTVIDGPAFVQFDTTGGTAYLLFLKLLPDGRYEPVSGQYDPDMSVKLIEDYRQPPATH